MFITVKVFDQYLHFVSLEEDLFIVRNQDQEAISYYGMNKAKNSICLCAACICLCAACICLSIFSNYMY